MYRKKEIIIIIIIILLTIFLAFLPTIVTSCNNTNDEIIENNEKEDYITIKIEGEVTKSNLEIKIPYGYSYGYIISKIGPYLNDFSIIDSNRTKRYYESTTIIIESSDINKTEEIIIDGDLININTASIDELTKLHGIGNKRAALIIEYRKNKNVESFSELKSLIGVSDEIIEIIKKQAIL